MIDIEKIRKDPDSVMQVLNSRGEELDIRSILEKDQRLRRLIVEVESLRATRNEVSKEIGKSGDKPVQLIDQMRSVGKKISDLDTERTTLDQEIRTMLLQIPNLPAEDVPYGKTEESNVVIETKGVIPNFDFNPLPHWDLAERLRIIDFERGAKIAGSRFFVLTGKGARLQRALINWFLDFHTGENFFKELYVPYLLTNDSALANGNLPKFADTMYHDLEDDMWLVPTAEMAITNMHRNEILPVGSLPISYVAHTPSFRRERAAAGRDTRGMKRVHQFEKVELYKFVEPEASSDALQDLLDQVKKLCDLLNLPFRTIQLCTGDLGFQSSKSFDIEVWAAGSQEWLEVSTCSNCVDFQARRASIRYRHESDGKAKFVHTLNGSGMALPRVIIAILENFQNEDGSVSIPEVLWPYTGFKKIEP